MLVSFLSKFMSRTRGTRSWLQARRDLVPLSIPFTEDGIETVPLVDNDKTEYFPIQPMSTWQKVVEPPPNRTPVSYPPRPTILPRVEYVPPTKKPEPYRRPPKTFFWLSMIILLALVGAFGVTSVMGRWAFYLQQHGPLSLQVTPQEVTVGATMSLRGTNFSPQGSIGLTRDASIPLLDTAGSSVTWSDDQGNFADTVQVQANWGSGSHTINAEDALTHKITSFPVVISGDSEVALRPSHLQLSVESLNLGSADQAEDSKQTIFLTNLGSGQISWQGSSMQPWLMMTPQSGTFYSGTQSKVIIAVDRSSLQPGSYSAQVLFTSNVGNIPLTVNMQVTTLESKNRAVLQVTPPVLSFIGNDGGSSLTPQGVTIGDPGMQPLNWIASTDVPWLSLSMPGGTLESGKTTQITASADTRMLLPGTYPAHITVSTRESGIVLHDLQTIDVTVTVTSYCDLIFSSGILSFTAAYLQPDPPSKSVSVTSSPSCSPPLSWNVVSNANWLTVNNWSGTTPSSLSVGVHPNGLAPGSYSGELTFTSSAGAQKLLVSFTLEQPNAAVLSVDSSSLVFNTAIGAQYLPTQVIRLTNSGTRSLLWSAKAFTQEEGSWLSVLPASGSLTGSQSTMFSVATHATDLPVGTYHGTVAISAVDSITQQVIGPPQRVTIMLNVGTACTLQAPSMSGMQFSTVQGTNPTTRTFQISVTGSCFGNVTVIPTSAMTSGSGWLAISPAAVTIGSGQSATFTVQVKPALLDAGLYNGLISLSAVNDGTMIAGSQKIKVALANRSGPAMKLSATSLSFSSTAGSHPADQTIQLSNVGGDTLTWSVGKPSQSWLSVSPSSGSYTAGTSSRLTFSINAHGLVASTTAYQAKVVIIPSNGATVTVMISLTVNDAGTSTANTISTSTSKHADSANSTPISKHAGSATSIPTSKSADSATSTPTSKSAGSATSTLTPKPVGSANPTPTSKPADSATSTPTPKPTASPNPTPISNPVGPANPTPTPKPTASPNPTPTPKLTSNPTTSPNSAFTPKPTVSPNPTPTPKPTASPNPTPTPKPSASSIPIPVSNPTAISIPTSTPKPTAISIPTSTPKPTDSAAPTPSQQFTHLANPTSTPKPIATANPEESKRPQEIARPTAAATPEATAKLKRTKAPEIAAKSS